MDAPQPAQETLATQRKKKRSKRLFIIVTVIIVALIISTVWALSSLNIIPGFLAIVISAFAAVFGAAFALLAVIPSDDKPDTPTTIQNIIQLPSNLSVSPIPSPSPSPDKPAARSIVGTPPPTDAKTILQREQAVKDIYNRLIQPDISAIVLTGIGGIGKSTLAALVYRYAKEQSRTGNGLLLAPPLWLRINSSVTMFDLFGNLCEALHVSAPDLTTLLPQNQAVALFNILNNVDQPRLIVLDQFENVLDDGHAKADRPGIGEWLDALNSQSCACRVLLTSRPDPQGTRDDPPTCLLTYPVRDLSETEGIELMYKWQVHAIDADMRIAVQRCRGHALSLWLLTSLLRRRHLSLATLLNDPHYAQLWKGVIAKNLLDAIYKELDSVERRLLAGFSVYREPAVSEAALAIVNNAELTRKQADAAIDILLNQHLLEAKGEGHYQLHAIVAEYARDHFVEGDEHSEEANQQALLAAHGRAAQYYLERAKTSYSPRKQRQKVSDVRDLIEATWQYCQAKQWPEAYKVMEEEHIFDDLKSWDNATLLELYELMLPLDKWHPSNLQMVHIYNNLGRASSHLGNKESAFKYYEDAWTICKKIGPSQEQTRTLNNLGWIYAESEKSEDWQKAQHYFQRVLEISKEIPEPDYKREASTLNGLGWLHKKRGEMELAQKCHEEALKIYEDHRSRETRRGESWTLYNLGEVCSALGQKPQAFNYYQKALPISREVGDREGEAKILHDVGILYYGESCYNIALACFMLARDISKSRQSPSTADEKRWIDILHAEVGEEQYKALLAWVEPRTQEIVEQALREGLG